MDRVKLLLAIAQLVPVLANASTHTMSSAVLLFYILLWMEWSIPLNHIWIDYKLLLAIPCRILLWMMLNRQCKAVRNKEKNKQSRRHFYTATWSMGIIWIIRMCRQVSPSSVWRTETGTGWCSEHLTTMRRHSDTFCLSYNSTDCTKIPIHT